MAAQSLGKSISRFIIVISTFGIGLKLLLKGLIDFEKFVILLVLSIVIASINNTWISLILALAGLGFFLFEYSGYDFSIFILYASSVGAVLMVLFGMYIMLGGLKRRK
jgi:hypothetical protein